MKLEVDIETAALGHLNNRMWSDVESTLIHEIGCDLLPKKKTALSDHGKTDWLGAMQAALINACLRHVPGILPDPIMPGPLQASKHSDGKVAAILRHRAEALRNLTGIKQNARRILHRILVPQRMLKCSN